MIRPGRHLQSLPCLQRIHFSPKSNCPNETENHLARERDVECALAPYGVIHGRAFGESHPGPSRCRGASPRSNQPRPPDCRAEAFVRLARVIADCTQSTHGAVRDVGAVFLRDVVLLLKLATLARSSPSSQKGRRAIRRKCALRDRDRPVVALGCTSRSPLHRGLGRTSTALRGRSITTIRPPPTNVLGTLSPKRSRSSLAASTLRRSARKLPRWHSPQT